MKKSGFTLIELIAVVLIIGLMTTVAVTRLDFMVPKYRLRGAVREVGAILKQGKARAAATGKEVYFEADLSQGRYGLLVAFPKALETGQTEEQNPVESRGVEYQLVLDRRLPDDVKFMEVLFSERDKVTSGRTRIRLSPFGVSTHVIFNFKNQEEQELAMKFNGFTGVIFFYDGHRDADELLEDAGP